MTRTISQRELRNDSGEIMRAVESGESFIITRNGVPTAALTPVRRRTFVPMEQALAAFRDLPRLDLSRLRADIDADVDPWLED